MCKRIEIRVAEGVVIGCYADGKPVTDTKIVVRDLDLVAVYLAPVYALTPECQECFDDLLYLAQNQEPVDYSRRKTVTLKNPDRD